MKPNSLVRRPAFLSLLLLVFVSCGKRPHRAESVNIGEGKASGRSTPPENAEHRRVREMLESVIIPEVNFEQTSAEEATGFAELEVRKHGPEKSVKMRVRRAKSPHDKEMEADPSWHGADRNHMGHDLKAQNITVWKLLERIASDNQMSVKVDEQGIQLMPLPEDGKPVELLPLDRGE